MVVFPRSPLVVQVSGAGLVLSVASSANFSPTPPDVIVVAPWGRYFGRGNIDPLEGPCGHLFTLWYIMFREIFVGSTLVSRTPVPATGTVELLTDNVWKPLTSLESMKWNPTTERYEYPVTFHPGGTRQLQIIITQPFQGLYAREVTVAPCKPVFRLPDPPLNTIMCLSSRYEGRLVAHEDKPVPNAPVTVTTSSEPNTKHQVKTDSSGRFTFEFTPKKAGDVEIRVDYAGEEGVYESASNVMRVSVKPGESRISSFKVESAKGGPPRKGTEMLISGLVTYQDGGPISDSELLLKLVRQGSSSVIELKTSTSKDGRFTASHVIPAEYSLPSLLGFSSSESWTLEASVKPQQCYTGTSTSLSFDLGPEEPNLPLIGGIILLAGGGIVILWRRRRRPHCNKPIRCAWGDLFGLCGKLSGHPEPCGPIPDHPCHKIDVICSICRRGFGCRLSCGHGTPHEPDPHLCSKTAQCPRCNGVQQCTLNCGHQGPCETGSHDCGQTVRWSGQSATRRARLHIGVQK